MILVDSSVWIDYFRGVEVTHTDALHQLLGEEEVVVGDLMLVEVLQGFRSDTDFDTARRLMMSVPVLEIGGVGIAVRAALNFRLLRRRGVTIRKRIDTLIATRCLVDGLTLLHNDRDFDPFAAELGLRVHHA